MEEEKGEAPMARHTLNAAGKSMGRTSIKMDQEVVGQHKWPTKLLSLLHPFGLDEYLDENLEAFFGLSLPLLDFRIGVQGIDESFSFVITKEDEDSSSNDQCPAKVMRLLRMSQKRWQEKGDNVSDFSPVAKEETKERELKLLHFEVDEASMLPDEGLRFFNSECWKISPYLSTVVPAFFLSTLVSIVEFDETDLTLMIQDWLY